MQIRSSRDDEREVVRATHFAAFAAAGAREATSVSGLAVDLLSDPSAQPGLSLLAERDGEIVGSVLFTPVRIDGPGETPAAAILCPLAVMPDAQRSGVGEALIEDGMHHLEAAGTALVFVLGDPGYYGRFGFEPAFPHGLRPDDEIAMPEAWQVRELVAGSLEGAEGIVRCAESLEDPAHW